MRQDASMRRKSAWIHADDGYDRTQRLFEAHYFYSRGEEDIDLPAGKFEVEILRGFEEPMLRSAFPMQAAKTTK